MEGIIPLYFPTRKEGVKESGLRGEILKRIL
jgi:hypothetical protein